MTSSSVDVDDVILYYWVQGWALSSLLLSRCCLLQSAAVSRLWSLLSVVSLVSRLSSLVSCQSVSGLSCQKISFEIENKISRCLSLCLSWRKSPTGDTTSNKSVCLSVSLSRLRFAVSVSVSVSLYCIFIECIYPFRSPCVLVLQRGFSLLLQHLFIGTYVCDKSISIERKWSMIRPLPKL